MTFLPGFKRTLPRHGNDLLDCGDHFIKSSQDTDKIVSEINFYQQLPEQIQPYFPRFLGDTSQGKWASGYKIEKINDYDASVYFVFSGNNAEKDVYFRSLFELLESFFSVLPKKEYVENDGLLDFIRSRDRDRLKRFDTLSNLSELKSLLENNSFISFVELSHGISNRIEELQGSSSRHPLFYSHGDLCLSNIIVKDKKLFLIDPRGSKSDVQYQSPYYDFAKLSQCFYGGYDFINHHQNLDGFNPSYTDLFEKLIQRFDLNLRLIRCVEASHFLTMLPLHSEAPQKCYFFLQQALRAFASSHD
jgi:hypothetical protein